MRTFGSALILASIFSSASADDFSKALERTSIVKARNISADLISYRLEGKNWPEILETQLPGMLDEACGYQDLVGIPPDTLARIKPNVMRIAGSRLKKTYSLQMTRPDAKLAYSQVVTTRRDGSDYALVVLRVTPVKNGDAPLSLLLRHSPNGSLALCDIVPAEKTDSLGILGSIGKELRESDSVPGY